jgi:hypothetical protein
MLDNGANFVWSVFWGARNGSEKLDVVLSTPVSPSIAAREDSALIGGFMANLETLQPWTKG